MFAQAELSYIVKGDTSACDEMILYGSFGDTEKILKSLIQGTATESILISMCISTVNVLWSFWFTAIVLLMFVLTKFTCIFRWKCGRNITAYVLCYDSAWGWDRD